MSWMVLSFGGVVLKAIDRQGLQNKVRNTFEVETKILVVSFEDKPPFILVSL